MNQVPAQTIGAYRVLGELARGNMGVVYRAVDPVLDRKVAIKLILAGEAEGNALERFRTEARATARLRHPNIVGILAAGGVQGKPYIAMDFIEGETLKARLRARGPFPPLEAARISERVARAVEYAHGLGVLHRDIKPANIILDPNGEPQLTDFGLAKLLGRDTKVTLSGEVSGTPVYMAPEQAVGENERIGPHTDVYALGATLYQLLTGKPPFTANSVVGVLQDVVNKRPTPPSELVGLLDAELEAICMQALEKEPKDRFLSAGALANALARYQAKGDLDGPRAAPVSMTTAPPSGGFGRGLAIGAVVAAALGLGLGLGWRSAAEEARALRTSLASEEERARAAQAEIETLLVQSGQVDKLENQLRKERDAAAQAQVGLALLEARSGGAQKAVEDLQALLAEHPDMASARGALADALVHAGQSADGLREAEAALAAQPDLPSALWAAARVLLAHDGAHPKGVAYLQRYLEQSITAEARFLEGRAHRLRGQDRTAKAILREVCEGPLSRQAPATLRSRAFCELAVLTIGDPGAVDRFLDKGVRPTARYFYDKAYVRVAQNRLAEASKNLEHAKTLDDPRPAYGWFVRGLYHAANQEPLRAIDAYRRSVALEPTHPASLNLAELLIGAEKADLALRPLDRALALLESRAGFTLRAQAHLAQGKRDAAQADLTATQEAAALEHLETPARRELLTRLKTELGS